MSEKTPTPDLLPCPFCGGEASADGVTEYNDDHEAWFADGARVTKAYFVNCVRCGCSNKGIVGGHQTREIAVEKWNTRKAPEPIQTPTPGDVSPPRATVKELMDERDLSIPALAQDMGMSPENLRDLLSDDLDMPITPDIAAYFAEGLDTTSMFWRRRERAYRESQGWTIRPVVDHPCTTKPVVDHETPTGERQDAGLKAGRGRIDAVEVFRMVERAKERESELDRNEGSCGPKMTALQIFQAEYHAALDSEGEDGS